MPRPFLALALGLVLAGCATPVASPTAPAQAPAEPPPRFALQHAGGPAAPTSTEDALLDTGLSLLDDDKSCGRLAGTGDSHPGDGRFYELSVDAVREGREATGSLVLYTKRDVLASPTIDLDPRVYRGTITKLAVKGDRAWAKGTLSDGRRFTLAVLDQVTDAITLAPPYDYFWFDTDDLHVEEAWLHEGDLVAQPTPCLP